MAEINYDELAKQLGGTTDYDAIAESLGGSDQPIPGIESPDVPEITGIPSTGASPETPEIPKPEDPRFVSGSANPTQEKAIAIGDFLGISKFGQGIASTGRILSGSAGKDEDERLSQLLKGSTDLTEAAKKLPLGSPERTRLLRMAYEMGGGDPSLAGGGFQTAADIDPGINLKPKEIAGSAASLALNLLAPGAFRGGKLAVMGKNALLGGGFGLASGLEQGEGKELSSTGIGVGIGLLFGIGGQALDRALPAISRQIEKINLRLTPQQKQALGNRLYSVTEWLAKKKIVGSPEGRFNKVDKIYNNMEEKLQNFLTANNTKVAPVFKSKLIAELEKLKKKFVNERDVIPIEKQINGMIDTLKLRYREKIPIARLNQLKRSTYFNAYNKAGDKVLDEVEHRIGDTFKKAIEKTTKGLKIDGQDIQKFNQEYGMTIQARKLLKIAKSRPQVGLVGKLVSATVGGALGTKIGGPVGAAIGTVIGQQSAEAIAGTGARSGVGAAIRKTAEAAKSKVGKGVRAVIKRIGLNIP